MRLSPSISQGGPPALFSFPNPTKHQPLLWDPLDKDVEASPPPSSLPPLLIDSQRHRFTEEEAQQNRFQMPPLEEGESPWGETWREGGD